MHMHSKLINRLLWTAHLLSAFLLPGVFAFLLYRGGDGNLPMYLFWTWYYLTRLLLASVAMLLVWRLWQRRWGLALALALLVGVDVLILYGYQFAFFVSSMAVGPS